MRNCGFVLCIPIYNAGVKWQDWITAYKAQTLQAEHIIVIDSSSIDQTAVLAEQAVFCTYNCKM